MKRESYPPARATDPAHKTGSAKVKARYAARLRALADETGLNGQDTGQDGAGQIANRSPPQVGTGPGGGILRGS